VIAIFNPLIKDSGKLILKTSQMSLCDAFSDASLISRASRSSSVARSLEDPAIGALRPTRSVPTSVPVQRQISSPPATIGHIGHIVVSEVHAQYPSYNSLDQVLYRCPMGLPCRLAIHPLQVSAHRL
jgi:hypothetical protein